MIANAPSIIPSEDDRDSGRNMEDTFEKGCDEEDDAREDDDKGEDKYDGENDGKQYDSD